MHSSVQVAKLCLVGTLLLLPMMDFRPRPKPLPSSQQELADASRRISAYVSDIRPKLFNELSGQEARVYASLEFEVTKDDHTLDAWASPDHKVIVTVGEGRAIEMNTDALLIEQILHKPNFLGSYIHYVAINRGTGTTFIKSPYDFAHMTDADQREFYSDPIIKEARVKLLGSALAFLLAHEVAHQLYGDPQAPTDDLRIRRDRETRADTWAINLLITKGVSPIGGIIPMLINYYVQRHPISHQENSDHPADLLRLRAMFQASLDRLPRFRNSIESSGQNYDLLKRQLEIVLTSIDDEVLED